MQRRVSFHLNGKPVRLDVDDDRALLWVLRSDLSMTGTKYGCGEALCGACTVLVDDRAVRACATQMKDVDGHRVVTIEGLSDKGVLHPIQQAFLRNNAFQCGYCTPGMILSAYALLQKTAHPTDVQIIEGMDGNFCRCGSHPRIVRAIQEAAGSLKAVVS
jgi:nicotinate dehydrogenase subunit A